jgi:hypothetical protein
MYVFIGEGDYGDLKNKLDVGYEVGGYFTADGSGRLHPVTSATGSHNRIVLPGTRSFPFHTHPGRCYSKTNCSFGVPSSEDMSQIANSGCTAHFVISHDGVYCIQPLNVQGSKGEIASKFKQLQDDFSSSYEDYSQFVRNWLDIANNSGYVATLSFSETPSFQIIIPS